MSLGVCPVCDATVPTGEGPEILQSRIDHMKTHGYDFSYLVVSTP